MIWLWTVESKRVLPVRWGQTIGMYYVTLCSNVNHPLTATQRAIPDPFKFLLDFFHHLTSYILPPSIWAFLCLLFTPLQEVPAQLESHSNQVWYIYSRLSCAETNQLLVAHTGVRTRRKSLANMTRCPSNKRTKRENWLDISDWLTGRVGLVNE